MCSLELPPGSLKGRRGGREADQPLQMPRAPTGREVEGPGTCSFSHPVFTECTLVVDHAAETSVLADLTCLGVRGRPWSTSHHAGITHGPGARGPSPQSLWSYGTKLQMKLTSWGSSGAKDLLCCVWTVLCRGVGI